jgi:hypothetical protein
MQRNIVHRDTHNLHTKTRTVDVLYIYVPHIKYRYVKYKAHSNSDLSRTSLDLKNV